MITFKTKLCDLASLREALLSSFDDLRANNFTEL